MKRFKPLAVAVASAAMLVPLVAPGSAGAAAYTKYTACKLTSTAPPASVCDRSVSNTIGAFFRSNAGDVFYSVRVRFPDGSVKSLNQVEAPKGVLSRAKVTTNILGRHKVTWFVKGRRVGIRYFTLVR